MVEKKNLMRKSEGSHPAKGANFEGAFRPKNETAKKQLTLKIDEGLHRKVKGYAVENDTTITDLISGFIRDL